MGVPTPVEVPTPKPAPVASPTSAPTLAVPAPPQANSCPGEPCVSSAHCRSKWGYCGSGSLWCNADSTWKAGGCSGEATPTLLPTPSPTEAPAPLPTAQPTPPLTDAPEPEPESEAEPEMEPEPE